MPDQTPSKDDIYKRNLAYSQRLSSYTTQLDSVRENLFRRWLIENKVPFDLSDPKPDYDMRGFWLALQNKDPKAVTAVDPNDQRIHYPDYWKTPYHATFSSESQWATKGAPSWNDKDQLVLPNGKVLFDDKAQKTGVPRMEDVTTFFSGKPQ